MKTAPRSAHASVSSVRAIRRRPQGWPTSPFTGKMLRPNSRSTPSGELSTRAACGLPPRWRLISTPRCRCPAVTIAKHRPSSSRSALPKSHGARVAPIALSNLADALLTIGTISRLAVFNAREIGVLTHFGMLISASARVLRFGVRSAFARIARYSASTLRPCAAARSRRRLDERFIHISNPKTCP